MLTIWKHQLEHIEEEINDVPNEQMERHSYKHQNHGGKAEAHNVLNNFNVIEFTQR